MKYVAKTVNQKHIAMQQTGIDHESVNRHRRVGRHT